MATFAHSLGLDKVPGMEKQQRPRVYTLEASSAAEGPGQTHVPNPPAEQ
jgi:hypothetical protein